MDQIHQEMRSHIEIASDLMKERYCIRAAERQYAKRDLVWYYNSQKKRSIGPKMQRN